MSGDWERINDQAHWESYKTGMEKIPHRTNPNRFPCLVRSKYDSSGTAWEHIFVYQEDAELLFGSDC